MVLRYTDRLILVTEETSNAYKAMFPFIEGRVRTIYNGFVEEYFSDDIKPFTDFTIVYSGNFYTEFVPPHPFFSALHKVLSEDPSLTDKINFLYVGKMPASIHSSLNKYNLGKIVRTTGDVSRKESISYIRKSSIMLLRIVPMMISTKLFEGLAAGLPILALVGHGEVEGIIKKYSASSYYIVPPDDVDAIAESIKSSYNKWVRGELRRAKNEEFLRDFNKRTLTGKFAGILNEMQHTSSDNKK